MMQMKWGEIVTMSGGRNHLIFADSIVREAIRDLSDANLAEIDEVMSLRLTGTNRIFGFMENEVMHILWWDPEHRVCPTKL